MCVCQEAYRPLKEQPIPPGTIGGPSSSDHLDIDGHSSPRRLVLVQCITASSSIYSSLLFGIIPDHLVDCMLDWKVCTDWPHLPAIEGEASSNATYVPQAWSCGVCTCSEGLMHSYKAAVRPNLSAWHPTQPAGENYAAFSIEHAPLTDFRCISRIIHASQRDHQDRGRQDRDALQRQLSVVRAAAKGAVMLTGQPHYDSASEQDAQREPLGCTDGWHLGAAFPGIFSDITNISTAGTGDYTKYLACSAACRLSTRRPR